ncbi:MAG: efflux RND transporter periplasmic adaptor subunit [Pseudomonadota bacterium]
MVWVTTNAARPAIRAVHPPWPAAVVMVTAAVVAGCTPEATEETGPPAVRGLITTTVGAIAETQVRRYPGVLEPSSISALSFEVAGRLGTVDLRVGQTVKAGELLAELDDDVYRNTLRDRRAAVDEAQALLAQVEDTLQRQQTLFARNVVSRVAVTDAETDVRSRQSQLTQAEQALATAEEDLADTKLFAPFDGLINAIDVEDFQTVGVGTTVLSLYETGAFEVSLSVSFDVASRLVVSTPATVRLADDPSTILAARVSELGERADTVSSFPVVVQLTETTPFLKAGMAVETTFEFALPAAEGHLIPISAAIPDVEIPEDASPGVEVPLEVFVYDETTGTVQRRAVIMAGIRENQFLVISGLEPGEHVATKGVSFLRQGMPVRLLADTAGE